MKMAKFIMIYFIPLICAVVSTEIVPGKMKVFFIYLLNYDRFVLVFACVFSQYSIFFNYKFSTFIDSIFIIFIALSEVEQFFQYLAFKTFSRRICYLLSISASLKFDQSH